MVIQTTPLVLGASLGEDGIIYLNADGKITNERLKQLSLWADKVKELIGTEAAKGKDPILVLADISGLLHYERKPITILRDLLAYDKQFPVRTAIVGGNMYVTILLESLFAILVRKNIRQFHAKSEALLWLSAGIKK